MARTKTNDRDWKQFEDFVDKSPKMALHFESFVICAKLEKRLNAVARKSGKSTSFIINECLAKEIPAMESRYRWLCRANRKEAA